MKLSPNLLRFFKEGKALLNIPWMDALADLMNHVEGYGAGDAKDITLREVPLANQYAKTRSSYAFLHSWSVSPLNNEGGPRLLAMTDVSPSSGLSAK